MVPSAATVSSVVENVVAQLLKKDNPSRSPVPPTPITPSFSSDMPNNNNNSNTTTTTNNNNSSSNINNNSSNNNNNGVDENDDDSNDGGPVVGEKHMNPERDNYNVDKITCCWKVSVIKVVSNGNILLYGCCNVLLQFVLFII
jgi:hypothetical protein